MASAEAVVLRSQTEYFVGNAQGPHNPNLIVMASRAVSDCHARIVTGDCSSFFSTDSCEYMILLVQCFWQGTCVGPE